MFLKSYLFSNPAVHRKTFGEITQTEIQSIKNFVVKLRSAATDCAFTCPNPDCGQDLASINIKDQFTRGLNNHILQAEILAKANQLKTLEDVIGYAESFESALRDQSTLADNKDDPDTVYHIRQRKIKERERKKRPEVCSGCGGQPHHQQRGTGMTISHFHQHGGGS